MRCKECGEDVDDATMWELEHDMCMQCRAKAAEAECETLRGLVCGLYEMTGGTVNANHPKAEYFLRVMAGAKRVAGPTKGDSDE